MHDLPVSMPVVPGVYDVTGLPWWPGGAGRLVLWRHCFVVTPAAGTQGRVVTGVVRSSGAEVRLMPGADQHALLRVAAIHGAHLWMRCAYTGLLHRWVLVSAVECGHSAAAGQPA